LLLRVGFLDGNSEWCGGDDGSAVIVLHWSIRLTTVVLVSLCIFMLLAGWLLL